LRIEQWAIWGLEGRPLFREGCELGCEVPHGINVQIKEHDEAFVNISLSDLG
jgi:hypothetical protein